MESNSVSRKILLLCGGVCSAAFFYADLKHANGFAAGIPHIFPVFIALLASSVLATALFAATGVALVLLAFFLTAGDGFTTSGAIYDRAVVTIVITTIAVFSVIHIRKVQRQQRRLKLLSENDPLTELPNQRALLSYLEDNRDAAVKFQQTWAILMVGLDPADETQPPWAGDHRLEEMLIKRLAQSIQRCMRSGGYVARYSRTVFSVVATQTDVTAARELGECIRDCAESLGKTAPQLRCTVSVGYAVATRPEAASRAILADADHALHFAHVAGHNCVRSSAVLLPEQQINLPLQM